MNLRFDSWPKFVGAVPWQVLGLLGGALISSAAGALHAGQPPAGADQPLSRAAPSHSGGRPENYIASQAERLGDPSFAVRERATRNLIEAGIAGRAALTTLLGDPDAEVRTRARQVLNVVRETDFRVRLKAFETDTTGQFPHDLPSWDRFRREIGDSREARQLFASMQRAEAALLETLAENPTDASARFAERCQVAQSALYAQMRTPDESGITTGTVAALLFVASAEPIHVDEQDAIYMDGIVHFPKFEENLKAGPQSPNCRRLLGRWIAKNAAPNIAIQNLTLAFNFQLKEGAELARRMLAANDPPVEMAPFVLLAVGRFGSRDDVPLVERLFKDARVCERHHRRSSQDVQIQVRDVALAVALHLTQQELKPYGLTQVKNNDQMLYLPKTIWFADEAAREAAFKKWSDWQVSQAHSSK